MNTNSSSGPEVSITPPTVVARVVATGNAGLKIADAMIENGFDGSSIAGVDTDAVALANCKAGLKLHLDPRAERTLGTGGDPVRARACAETQGDQLKKLCDGVGTLLIVTSLGGGAGTGIAPVVARTAREAGARVVVLAVMPFDCEGTLRAQIALAGLRELKEAADFLVVLPNQKVLGFVSEGASLIETFRCSNERFAMYVRTMWSALLSTNVIGLRFCDLCSLLRQRSTDFAIALAQAEGTNRSQEALEKALADPMLGGAEALQHSTSIGVCVLGGPSLAAAEVSRATETVRRACGDSPILVSASISSELNEGLAVVILAARPEEQPEPAAPSAENVLSAPPVSRPIGNLDYQFVTRQNPPRPHTRILPPPPSLSPEKIKELRKQPRKASPRMRQTQLPLEIISKGRFDHSEPTIHKGEDLDVPTYIRRGVILN